MECAVAGQQRRVAGVGRVAEVGGGHVDGCVVLVVLGQEVIIGRRVWVGLLRGRHLRNVGDGGMASVHCAY